MFQRLHAAHPLPDFFVGFSCILIKENLFVYPEFLAILGEKIFDTVWATTVSPEANPHST